MNFLERSETVNYEIIFAVACSTGKIRRINQDNFLCCGKYLASENNGLEKTESGKIGSGQNPIFAVFDGMGGGQYGESAAHIAAETLYNLSKDGQQSDIRQFFINSCMQINNNIASYAELECAGCVGTTAAMLIFGDDTVYTCNIGDSKIYRYCGEELTQISKDHVISLFNRKQPALYQFLGMPEKDFLNPHIACEDYKSKDIYLICSDGLTDMLSEEKIKSILADNTDIPACTGILLENALLEGGKDNITLILCEIKDKET